MAYLEKLGIPHFQQPLKMIMKKFSLNKIETMLYELEMYLIYADEKQIEKLEKVMGYFESILLELSIEYDLQESIKRFGDRRTDGKED